MQRSLRRLLVSGAVWLTAASTLLASFPHVECRCPSGRIKVLCLGQDCDVPSPDEPAAQPPPAGKAAKNKCCCCRESSEEPSKSPSQRARVQATCEADASTAAPPSQSSVQRARCSKNLAQPELSAATAAYSAASEKLFEGCAGFLPDLAVCVSTPVGQRAGRAWSCHGEPAPPNLIVTLQHFLI